MRTTIPFALLLVCAGCATSQQTDPAFTQVSEQAVPNEANCHDYSATATIDGKPQTIVGRACQQADGSWRVSESVSGQPTQYVVTYQPPPYAEYPYDEAWLWGPPLGFSLGAVVFVDHDHHFHRFHAFDHFHHFGFGGMHHEFAHHGGGGFTHHG
jgi:surface antigen